MARKKTARQRATEANLDKALATILEGNSPQFHGNDRFAVIRAPDPYETSVRDPTKVKGEWIVPAAKSREKIIALRNDPLAMMYVRGTIDRVQHDAGRAYQRDWHDAEIGGARGIDPAKDVVDGGKLVESDTDKRLKAHAELKRIHAALGEYGRDLVSAVLGLNIEVARVALMWGLMEQSAYRALRHRFAECLDTIAKKKGYAPERPALGPRRERDKHDVLAKFAENPGLHTAARLAREIKRA